MKKTFFTIFSILFVSSFGYAQTVGDINLNGFDYYIVDGPGGTLYDDYGPAFIELDQGTGQYSVYDLYGGGYEVSTNLGYQCSGYCGNFGDPGGFIFDIDPDDYTWQGTTSTDWNTASNWYGNAVPSTSVSVYINDVANDPVIGSGTAAGANGLNIYSGASLTIAPGGSLTVDAGVYNYGTLTIQSNSSGTGSLISVITFTGSGTYNIERFIDDWNTGDGWHFLSSPVASQSISTEFVDISGTISTNLDFYRWSETQDLWINIRNGSNTYNQGSGESFFSNDADPKFTVGEGYLVSYSTDQTKTFTGDINNADVSKTGLTYTGGSTYYGANLLGNPYPCALEWDQTSWNRSNVDGTAKIWNSGNASYSDIAKGGIIPAMQGFMVLVSSSGTGSLTIDKDDRTHSTTSWYKNDEANKLKITVYDIVAGTAQESILMAKDDATNEFDHEYDSPFFEGYAPKFYSKIEGTPASSNAISEFLKETLIPFSFGRSQSTEFYIKLEGSNSLTDDLDVYLYDYETGISHNLSETPEYYFSSTNDGVSDRFIIGFTDITSVEEAITKDHINIYASNNKIHISSLLPLTGNIKVFNLYGQIETILQVSNKQSVEVEIDNPKGYYIVQFSNNKVYRVENVFLY